MRAVVIVVVAPGMDQATCAHIAPRQLGVCLCCCRRLTNSMPWPSVFQICKSAQLSCDSALSLSGRGPETCFIKRAIRFIERVKERFLRQNTGKETAQHCRKNWIAGSYGPTGEHLIELLRHSDTVLVVVLELAGRQEVLAAHRMGLLRRKLASILCRLDEICGVSES